jgi:LAGLIDADG endonuclease
LVGFVDAEGCFYVKIVKNVYSKLKFQLCFSISQHCRDLMLMNHISDYLKCGLIEKPQTRKEARFVVYRFNDHLNNIIPFFSKYNLLSVKNLDYNDFRTIANLINEKKDLTEEDIIKIKTLKFNMNKNRIDYK